MSDSGSGEEAIYFAYGSNMLESRMKQRAPSAVAIGTGALENYRISFNKEGGDGSGKANIEESPGSVVYGVLYRLNPADLIKLDGFESGYERRTFEIKAGKRTIQAHAYISTCFTEEPVALRSYKDMVLDGAREHGLPEHYLKELDDLPCREET